MTNLQETKVQPAPDLSTESITHRYKFVRKKKHPHPPGSGPLPPGGRGLLTFRGKGQLPRDPDTFTVLCGDKPPTIVGGYAKWDNVARPLRRALTVFQGYEPAQMKVDVRFGFWTTDGWDTSHEAGQAVERDIEILEWMAGANFVGGPSPYVFAFSRDPSGTTTSLISSYYQQTQGITGPLNDKRLWPWIINGGIEWGEAWRTSERALRVYQEATFTLTNFQGLSPLTGSSSRGGYFVSKAGRDTALLIAEAPSGHSLYPSPLSWRIVDSPKNKHLKLRSNKQKIKHGKKVWIPSHQV